MGWNTGILLADGIEPDAIAAALPDICYLTGDVLDWETASSSALAPRLAIGRFKGWGVLFDPNVRIAMDESALAAVSTRRALMSIVSSVSNYYGFCYYEEGKHRRTLIRSGQKVIEDAGEPLPEEEPLTWKDGEDTIIALCKSLTGIDFTSANLWGDLQFQVVAF